MLHLDKQQENIFLANNIDLGITHIFGGQVLAQAIYASYNTLEKDRYMHSLHSYFLLPGQLEKPIIYDVENLRDGSSFSAKRIKAIQDDRPIFHMTASYQKEQNGLIYQENLSEVPTPDVLPGKQELAKQLKDVYPDTFIQKFILNNPIDIKFVTVPNLQKENQNNNYRYVWMKLNDPIANQEISTHQALLAFASDLHFLSTALQVHGLSYASNNLRLATIDHAIWFHEKFDFNQWILYAIKNTKNINSRGFVLGQFYDKDKKLLASTSQEGLLRVKN